MAIFPAPAVAALILATWATVRIEVRAAAPVLAVLIAGSVMSVDPTEAQVPFETVTGREVAGLILASLRASDPDPVVYAWIVAVPLIPPLPILARHDAPTVAAPAGAATVITRMTATVIDKPTPNRRRPWDVARIDPSRLRGLTRDAICGAVSPLARRGPGDRVRTACPSSPS